MKHFDIKEGEWPSAEGAPVQQVADVRAAGSAALLGVDTPDLRPHFEVAEGDHVVSGQTLFSDRKHPRITFVSPVSGTVSTLAYGPRRTLSACIIEADSAAPTGPSPSPPDAGSGASVRAALLARGLWPAFRTRPFGRMPDPDAAPAAIFVNAAPTSPLAPDPTVVLDGQIEAFRRGASLLTLLTGGVVFVCQAPGEALAPVQDRVIGASFAGTVAAGLASTHIDRLHGAGPGRQVWTIGYQDVAAIGHLFLTGQYVADRVVSVAGTAATRPELVRTCLGAAIADIIGDGRARALSGDAYSGREAVFLGRFHDQVTPVAIASQAPGATWIGRLFRAPGAVIPTDALERALALDILPVPLLRALSIGDSEAARRLGCLALIEEDVAALSRRCTSGADYGVLLRGVLDDLMAEAA